ncbi:MAG: DUF3048 domain-containing protein [Clostridia bacterium]|nr:DUF3048 domain-containing protein [Clostridia bacterium]
MKNICLKVLSVALCLCLSFVFVGCERGYVVVSDISSTTSVETSSEPEKEESQFVVNPLTGLENLDPTVVNNRPVAVMVNNLKPTAQQIQTGLDQADIVYEAYAEGGVTRLLAVFKNIKAADQIGSIRSARYSYVDLAMGHDAVYVHAGINDTHAEPHVNETKIDNINLLLGKFNGMSFREKNGKAYEHTLYTTGEKLWKGFEKLKWRTTLDYNKENWQNFVSADAQFVPTSGTCDVVSVTMSGAYVSKFEYDSANKVYKKFSGTSKHSDYKTGKQLTFKNVLVLKTEVTALSRDGKIVKTGLTGGEGYYVSNGGYQKIKWSKGSTKNPIKITLEDGSVCNYNPGNTWVCLVDQKNSVKITDSKSETTATASK